METILSRKTTGIVRKSLKGVNRVFIVRRLYSGEAGFKSSVYGFANNLRMHQFREQPSDAPITPRVCSTNAEVLLGAS
jgi:hypothetical protein